MVTASPDFEDYCRQVVNLIVTQSVNHGPEDVQLLHDSLSLLRNMCRLYVRPHVRIPVSLAIQIIDMISQLYTQLETALLSFKCVKEMLRVTGVREGEEVLLLSHTCTAVASLVDKNEGPLSPGLEAIRNQLILSKCLRSALSVIRILLIPAVKAKQGEEGTGSETITGVLLSTLKSLCFYGLPNYQLKKDSFKPLYPSLLSLIPLQTNTKTSNPASKKKATKNQRSKRARSKNKGSDHDDEDDMVHNIVSLTLGSETSDSEAEDVHRRVSDSDIEGLTRRINVKIRLLSFQLLENIFLHSSDKRSLFAYWTSFIPEKDSLSTPFTTAWSGVKDPSSKVRSASLSFLNELILSGKAFVPSLVSTGGQGSTSFTPLSVTVGSMVSELHSLLFGQLFLESESELLIMGLKCLETLVIITPYNKLPSSLIVQVVKKVNLLRNGCPRDNIQLERSCLSTLTAVFSIRPLPVGLADWIKGEDGTSLLFKLADYCFSTIDNHLKRSQVPAPATPSSLLATDCLKLLSSLLVSSCMDATSHQQLVSKSQKLAVFLTAQATVLQGRDESHSCSIPVIHICRFIQSLTTSLSWQLSVGNRRSREDDNDRGDNYDDDNEEKEGRNLITPSLTLTTEQLEFHVKWWEDMVTSRLFQAALSSSSIGHQEMNIVERKKMQPLPLEDQEDDKHHERKIMAEKSSTTNRTTKGIPSSSSTTTIAGERMTSSQPFLCVSLLIDSLSRIPSFVLSSFPPRLRYQMILSLLSLLEEEEEDGLKESVTIIIDETSSSSSSCPKKSSTTIAVTSAAVHCLGCFSNLPAFEGEDGFLQDVVNSVESVIRRRVVEPPQTAERTGGDFASLQNLLYQSSWTIACVLTVFLQKERRRNARRGLSMENEDMKQKTDISTDDDEEAIDPSIFSSLFTAVILPSFDVPYVIPTGTGPVGSLADKIKTNLIRALCTLVILKLEHSETSPEIHKKSDGQERIDTNISHLLEATFAKASYCLTRCRSPKLHWNVCFSLSSLFVALERQVFYCNSEGGNNCDHHATKSFEDWKKMLDSTLPHILSCLLHLLSRTRNFKVMSACVETLTVCPPLITLVDDRDVCSTSSGNNNNCSTKNDPAPDEEIEGRSHSILIRIFRDVIDIFVANYYSVSRSHSSAFQNRWTRRILSGLLKLTSLYIRNLVLEERTEGMSSPSHPFPSSSLSSSSRVGQEEKATLITLPYSSLGEGVIKLNNFLSQHLLPQEEENPAEKVAPELQQQGGISTMDDDFSSTTIISLLDDVTVKTRRVIQQLEETG